MRIMNHCLLIPALFLLCFANNVSATDREGGVRLASVFADHMVLQRGKPVPVWGWASPGERITVEFAGQKKESAASADGRWQITLDPMTASKTPHTLTVVSPASGFRFQVSDILIGEVWLGSGQSNMAWLFRNTTDFPRDQSTMDLPQVRMFKERSNAAPEVQQDAQGEWVLVSPENAGNFSGLLLYFGKELFQELGVPIGLIDAAVGGTPIESWVPSDAQQGASPQIAERAEQLAKAYHAFDVEAQKKKYQEDLRVWEQRVTDAKTKGTPALRKPFDPVFGHFVRGAPGYLYNGKIAPLSPFALRGVLWYQGENNANLPDVLFYEEYMRLLVNSWRAKWGETLPVAWVQLPNYRGERWPWIREAQLKALSLPATGMAIAIDLGERDNIHPGNKRDVANRLAQWAMGAVYGKSVPAVSGPLFLGYQLEGCEVKVSFLHANGGLISKGGALRGFFMAGEDRVWREAQAEIRGDTVVIWHPDVPVPVDVRYAWAGDPQCNLYNGAGLPASPFRTDVWLE